MMNPVIDQKAGSFEQTWLKSKFIQTNKCLKFPFFEEEK